MIGLPEKKKKKNPATCLHPDMNLSAQVGMSEIEGGRFGLRVWLECSLCGASMGRKEVASNDHEVSVVFSRDGAKVQETDA